MMTHILIVEDQAMVRKLLESYAEKDPELVLAASIPGANFAPELCRRQPVDLVLMDVQTENRENGLSAAARIKKERPQIKLLVVTSLLDAEVLRQAKPIGADSLWYRDGSEAPYGDCASDLSRGARFPRRTARRADRHGEKQRIYRGGNARASLPRAGMSYSATAETLGVDARTVKFHVSNMLQKTNFENNLQLAVAAIENRPTANFPEE